MCYPINNKNIKTKKYNTIMIFIKKSKLLDNGEEYDGFPGVDLIFGIIASVIVLFWIKKRKGR